MLPGTRPRIPDGARWSRPRWLHARKRGRGDPSRYLSKELLRQKWLAAYHNKMFVGSPGPYIAHPAGTSCLVT